MSKQLSNDKIWDIICVGGGPAGLSCAIRGAELGLNILVLEARSGTATAGSMTVDGYPGFFSITRQELLDKMAKQAKYHAIIKYAERVSKLDLHSKIKRVFATVSRGEFFTEEMMYQGRTVLIASGLHPKRLGIPGERKYHNKGVYYNLPKGEFSEKTVTIIGHTSWAIRNALHFDAQGAKVYLITGRNSLDVHPALLRRLNDSFVDIKYSHEIQAFEGTNFLQRIITKDSEGNSYPIFTDLVIILSSKIRNRELFLDAGLDTSPEGRIIIKSSDQDTNIPGVYAAGSAVRGDSIVGIDAAEGQKAAMEISKYLEKLEKSEIAIKEKLEQPDSISQRFVEGDSIIVEKEDLSPEIVKWVIKAPQIAKKAQPGQFVIMRVTKRGERIPLTIADYDRKEGTITVIFQKIGKTTKLMGNLDKNNHILDILGPLGKPVEIEKWGTVAVLGGGCGVAPLLPKTRALKELGNYIIGIISARSGSLLICRNEMVDYSDELHIATDDGTLGHHGFGLDILVQFVEKGRKIDHVVAVGPIPMMRAVCKFTKTHNIPTTVSLDPIMVDGTGMCGACRVTIGGEVKFACVDGPNFDGHLVDFEELLLRSKSYLYEERISADKITHSS